MVVDQVAPAEDSPEFQYQAAERNHLVQTSVTGLDIQEESLIKLLYGTLELTFAQIADDWWIDEPTLREIHESVLLKLRQDLHWRGVNELADIL